MTRFMIARGLIGVAVLLGASLSAPASPRAGAVDVGAYSGTPTGWLPARAGSTPAAPIITPPAPLATATPAPLAVIARYVDGSGEAMVLTTNPHPEAWRHTPEGSVFVTEAQLTAAFLRAGFRRAEAERLARACVVCEAPYYDIRVGAETAYRVTPSLGAGVMTMGDDGASHGPCAIHRPTWGHLFTEHDPHTLAGTAAIAKAAHDDATRRGLDPLTAWTCAREGR